MKEQLGCQAAAAATAAWLGCPRGRQDPGTLPGVVHIWLDTPCSRGCPQLAASRDGGSDLGHPDRAPRGLWPECQAGTSPRGFTPALDWAEVGSQRWELSHTALDGDSTRERRERSISAVEK